VKIKKRGKCLVGKELAEMTGEELGRLFPIILTDEKRDWVGMYFAEKAQLIKTFGEDTILKIEHIGSTAVPNLTCKPTVDIMVQIAEQADIEEIKEKFKQIGYRINQRKENPPPHLTFIKGYGKEGFEKQVYHVHLRYTDDWDEVYFRDYLREHRSVAEDYVKLKRELAEKYRYDREAYTEGKGEFIKGITEIAKGLPKQRESQNYTGEKVLQSS
jgi:GrpB-like predicted nucleotidyltransferase (UPF0157 family)